MMLIKIIITYIVVFELWRWCFVRTMVKKWRRTKTYDALIKEHETFLALVGLGKVLEEIGFIVIIIYVLFFIL